MRVLIASSGSRGDVEPFLTLARALQDRGHSVTVSLSAGFEERAAAVGVHYEPNGHDPRRMRQMLEERRAEGWRSLRDGFLPLALQGLVFDLIEQARRLARLARESDLLISAGPWPAPMTAVDATGVAHVRVGLTPAKLPSSQHPPPDFPFHVSGWRARSLWTLYNGSRSIVFRSARRLFNDERRRMGLPPERRVMEDLTRRDVERIMLADPLLLPIPTDAPGRWTQPGALLPYDDGTPLPDALDEFLASGPPPIYLGFGSMQEVPPEAISAMATAAARRVGCRLLLSAGWVGLGDVGADDHVRTIGDVPHGRLFPRCAGVVHHGGAGTFTTAAAAGVPQLVVPHRGDHYHHARRGERLGIAVKCLGVKQLSRETFADRFGRMLEDEGLRRRALEVGAVVSERDPLPALLHRIEAAVGGAAGADPQAAAAR